MVVVPGAEHFFHRRLHILKRVVLDSADRNYPSFTAIGSGRVVLGSPKYNLLSWESKSSNNPIFLDRFETAYWAR